MQILKMNNKDLRSLQKLWEGQHLYHYKADPITFTPLTDKIKKDIKNYLKEAGGETNTYILLAKEKSRILGFICFILEKEDYFDSDEKEFGVIREFFVEDGQRGKGVGEKLLKAAEKIMKNKGIKTMYTYTSWRTPLAHKFYKKNGYYSMSLLMQKKI